MALLVGIGAYAIVIFLGGIFRGEPHDVNHKNALKYCQELVARGLVTDACIDIFIVHAK